MFCPRKISKNNNSKDRQNHHSSQKHSGMACSWELHLFEGSLQALLSAMRYHNSHPLNSMRGKRFLLNNNSHSLQYWLAVRHFEKEGLSGAVVLSEGFRAYVNTIGWPFLEPGKLSVRRAMALPSFKVTSPSSFSSNWTSWPETHSTRTSRFFKEATVCGGGMVNMSMRPKEESFSSNDIFERASPSSS